MRRGFSIVELLISIAILGTITTFVIANFSSQRGKEVDSAVNNLVSLIRKAQVWSITGRQFNGQVSSGGFGVSIPICRVPPCKAALFADTDGSFTFNSIDNISGAAVNNPNSEKVEEIILNDVEIMNVVVTSLNNPSYIDIVFRPPQGQMCATGSTSGDTHCSTSGSTLLEMIGSNQSRSLQINPETANVYIP